MKPQCSAMTAGKERCKKSVSALGALTCSVHGGAKAVVKDAARAGAAIVLGAENVPWIKLLTSGVTALLHDDNEALEEGMTWLVGLASLLLAEQGKHGLTLREVRGWFQQEDRTCRMIVALVRHLGREPCEWLISLCKTMGSEEQTHSLTLAGIVVV